MKVFFLGWIMVFCLSTVEVCAQFLTRTVVSAMGTNTAISGGFVSGTLGEVVSGTIGCSQVALTQGFHQPLSNIDYEVPDLTLDVIDVYPNPFSDKLNIIIKVKDINNYYIDIYTIQGSKLHSFELKGICSGMYQTDMEKCPPGVYVLNVRSPSLKTNRTFRIVKI